MVTPSGAPSAASATGQGGIIGSTKNFVSEQVEKGKKMLGQGKKTPEEKAQAERAAFKKTAQAYEKRAKEMEKRAKGKRS
jgi:hypothetical protein